MTIELLNISKSFDRALFKDISMKISDGEFVAIKGESGSGKTTLLNILGAVEEADTGRIRIGDMDITRISARKQRNLFRNQISFVFQNFGLLENETIFKNLSLVLKIKKAAKNSWKKQILAVMEQVNLGYIDVTLKPHSLSGGEQQRVALARTILSNNPIILADEPTGSLDEKNGDLVMRILGKLNELGKTVVVVTHTDKYDDMFSRIVVLKRHQVKSKD
ncbi:MAG: ABC transporter ATP-binding protein [Streptococcaceae bacterium]|jgi:putative ABC transport system ATP-binding protein|nr:ABC transporter ATP-binding protein [Streptococcaceae bacterium]